MAVAVKAHEAWTRVRCVLQTENIPVTFKHIVDNQRAKAEGQA
jgi:hypothetical protein